MKINGYKLNVNEDFLDDIFAHKTRIVELVNKDFSGYKNLTEGNKKALEHLVAAAKIFDEVAMEQDHELNLLMKKALEDAAVSNTHAAKALRLFTKDVMIIFDTKGDFYKEFYTFHHLIPI